MARLVRFFALGLLAIAFGESILRWAKSPAVQIAILVLVAISVVGSVVSIVSWIKRSREARA